VATNLPKVSQTIQDLEGMPALRTFVARAIHVREVIGLQIAVKSRSCRHSNLRVRGQLLANSNPCRGRRLVALLPVLSWVVS